MQRRLTRCVVAAALAIAALAGCGSAAKPAAGPGPELRSLTVALVPSESVAGFYIDQQDGIFKKYGLTVKVETATSAVTVIPALDNGSNIDIAEGQYGAFITADANGTKPLEILAPAFAFGPKVTQIITGPHSGIKSPGQLKGKTIAVNALNSQVSDLVYSTLAPYGLTQSDLHLTAIPFPDMGAALAAGKVSAAYETEPFGTEDSQKDGTMALADVDSGADLNMWIAGYAVLKSWAQKYPRTARAFAAAIEAGNRIASTNLHALQTALQKALHLSPDITSTMATGTFPTVTSRTQLQRVANLMLQYGQLRHPFNVAQMTSP